MTTLKGQRPPLLRGEGWRGLVYPLLAAALVAAALDRESTMKAALDPVALGLRAIAIALALRSLPAMRALGRRLRLALGASAQTLSLEDDALVWTGPTGERRIEREALVRVHVGDGHLELPRVWLVHRPSAGVALTDLPPVFDSTPKALAARIDQWRGDVEAPESVDYPKPAREGSKVYDRAAKGDIPAGVAVVRHGVQWLRRMPFAAVLAAGVFLDGAFRTPSLQLGYLGLLPIVGVVVCTAIPLGWIVVALRHVRPRRGLALVATPAEILMRTREGILRASWAHLESITLSREPALTVLEGWTQRRRVILKRDGERNPIRYDEAFLGAPADAVVALLEAYRSGLMVPVDAD